VYAHACTRTHTHIKTNTCIITCSRTNACTHTHTQAHALSHTHARTHTHTNTCVITRARTHACTHNTHMRAPARTHACTHNTHVRTPARTHACAHNTHVRAPAGRGPGRPLPGAAAAAVPACAGAAGRAPADGCSAVPREEAGGRPQEQHNHPGACAECSVGCGSAQQCACVAAWCTCRDWHAALVGSGPRSSTLVFVRVRSTLLQRAVAVCRGRAQQPAPHQAAIHTQAALHTHTYAAAARGCCLQGLRPAACPAPSRALSFFLAFAGSGEESGSRLGTGSHPPPHILHARLMVGSNLGASSHSTSSHHPPHILHSPFAEGGAREPAGHQLAAAAAARRARACA